MIPNNTRQAAKAMMIGEVNERRVRRLAATVLVWLVIPGELGVGVAGAPETTAPSGMPEGAFPPG
jgi:hypothetical protein